MLRLIQFLIFGHVHKWVTIREAPLVDLDKDRIGVIYYQQCEACGKVVRSELY